ncbi:MAG: tetratricopeptide repeat protein, partial [Thermoguttaceae bacterium]
DFAHAEAAFLGALKYHPDYADVHFHLGLLLKRQNRKEEALQHFQLFMQLSPESPWISRLQQEEL